MTKLSKRFLFHSEYKVNEGRHMFISLRRIQDDTISRDLLPL